MKSKNWLSLKGGILFSWTLPLLFCVVMLQNGCGDKTAKSSDCIDKSKISNDPCLSVYDPVCGCDGKTYSNSCKAGNAGLKSWEEGECDKKEEE